MTSGFSGERPTLVPRHIIPCHCKTGNRYLRRARTWVLVIRQGQLKTGAGAASCHPVSGNDIEFQFFYQRAPEILVTSGFSGERPALVLRHAIPCQAMTLNFSFCYQHRLVTSRFSGEKPTLCLIRIPTVRLRCWGCA